MYIKEDVWLFLQCFSDNYLDKRKGNILKSADVFGLKNMYMQTLVARIDALEALDDDRKEVIAERGECSFLHTMLSNGWNVPDMEFFARLFEMVDGLKGQKMKEMGEILLSDLINTKANTVNERYDLLNRCGGFIASCGKLEAAVNLVPYYNEVLGAKLNVCEYSNDEEFIKGFDEAGYFNPNRIITKGRPIKEYAELYTRAMRHADEDEAVRQGIREKDFYVVKEKTDEELESFELTEGHKAHKLKKSTRNAIKEVYGDEIYDDIDEMSKGTREERIVTIHHALGNSYLRRGEEVLELDYAGSGFKEARREHHGHHGKAFSDKTRNSEESILSEYGPQVLRSDGTPFDYLRSKTSPDVIVDGKVYNKTRYTIAGPSPEHGGIWNFGEYSIESTRAYGRDFSAEFLDTIFKQWERNKEKPHDIHINLTGHSRGAVAAGECMRLVNKWMKEYVKKHPKAEEYKKYIMYETLLRDPVPGAITNWRLGKQDFRKIPNSNVTVFCSVAQEHNDLAFPLQNVRGAKRVIIGAMGHDMDLGRFDASQVNEAVDESYHKVGYYDAETGELYRGSGVAEMPDGVFIADDNMNMIRITSYSQVSKLINAIYSGKPIQKGRVNTIHDMARNWFVDNDLKMGFPDKDEYEDAYQKNEQNIDKLLKAKSSRLKGIKKALNELREARNNNLNEAVIVEKEKALIQEGKKYMEKTRIPNSGDSQYRMDLVSDIVSFSMREKNYLVRKNNLDNNADVEGRALDAKIKAQKNRLANKPGALERKVEKAQKRLIKDESALDIINKTAEWCKIAAKNLAKTNNGLETSQYQRFYNTIQEGTKLGPKTTINQFKDYLVRMNHAAIDYKNWNAENPESAFGKARLKYDEKFIDITHSSYEAFDKNTRFDAEKNKPIGMIVKERRADLANLKKKLPNQPENEMGNQPEAGGNARQQAPVMGR